MNYKYECEELMEKLEDDIRQFGGGTLVKAIAIKKDGRFFYFDYIKRQDERKNPYQLKDGEEMAIMTMTALMIYLGLQNHIF